MVPLPHRLLCVCLSIEPRSPRLTCLGDMRILGPSSTSSCFHVFVLTPYRRAVVYTSMLHHCICCFAVVLYRYIHIIPASSHSRHTHRISPAGDGRYPAEYPPDAACLFPLILPPVPRTLPAHDLPYAPLYDHHVSSRCRSRARPATPRRARPGGQGDVPRSGPRPVHDQVSRDHRRRWLRLT